MKRNSLHLMPYFISFIPFPPNFLPSQLGSLHHVDSKVLSNLYAHQPSDQIIFLS